MRSVRALLAAASLTLALSTAGCRSAAAGAPCSDGWLATIYLGRSIEDGGRVAEADWTRFVDELVVPRFPDGFTTFRGEGAWRGGPGKPVIHEDCFVLQIVHCETDAAERSLREITTEYAARFRQEAVLRTETRTRLVW